MRTVEVIVVNKLLIYLLTLGLLVGCQAVPPKTPEPLEPNITKKVNPAIVKAEEELDAAQPVVIAKSRSSRRSIDNSSKTKVLTETATIKIFQADSQCESLISSATNIAIAATPETLTEEMIAATLQNMLETQKIAHFQVAKYSVDVDGKVATVDITVAPNSRRGITSLSSCEQFAFFKAIEATLTENQFNVGEVRFTQSGKDVYL